MKRDVSCDSYFLMLDNIHGIGKSIRRAYAKVTKSDKPIVLIMDNAGRHGPNDVKNEYEEILRDQYKMLVHWQVGNFPKLKLPAKPQTPQNKPYPQNILLVNFFGF